jgi:Domain of unknown function DUF29
MGLSFERRVCRSTLSAMPDSGTLHDTDFLAWTRLQAEALRAAARAGANMPLDWELLAEEIEDLGRKLQFELKSRLATVIEHLLKLQYSPATHAHAGWRRTIRRSRDEIAMLLEGNRTLRQDVPAMIAEVAPRTARRVASDLLERGEITPAVMAQVQDGSFTEAEVLEDWFPNTSGT